MVKILGLDLSDRMVRALNELAETDTHDFEEIPEGETQNPKPAA